MIINLRNIPIGVAKATCLIEHCDEVDVPLVDLGVGGAGDEGGVVVHRHRGLQVVQDPGGVGHRHRTHHHGRNLKKQDQMTHLVGEEAFIPLVTVCSLHVPLLWG